MNPVIRVLCAVNEVSVANPDSCAQSVEKILALLEESPADIVVFPKLALSSPGCGDLFYSSALLDACRHQLEHIRIMTRDLKCYLIIGLPISSQGRVISAMAVLYQGELLGYIPSADDPAPLSPAAEASGFLPADTVFGCGNLRFVILPVNPSLLPMKLFALSHTGFDLAIVPSYSPVVAGSTKSTLEIAKAISFTTGTAVAVVNGGLGDSSSPYLYRGYAAVYECGQEIGYELVDRQELTLACDLDLDVIRSQKRIIGTALSTFEKPSMGGGGGLHRPVSKNPYLPDNTLEREAFLSELFDFQVLSLSARLKNTGIKKVVIGVSGGLDSTLAMLVAAAAMDRLRLPRENILGITMPGFGTSDRTYYNALALIEAIGATGRDISIRASMLQHFEDISHSPAKHDTTYENAQARERTQILLDLANSVGGLVVGTGDLSEEALGFCTFAGDHIANYNVNTCITKTCIRLLVAHIADMNLLGDLCELLQDILSTPVSPELLPSHQPGEMAQKTEDILGPYELHDFFLYHLVRYKMRPSRIYYYACIAFSEAYDHTFIKEKLVIFIRKLAGGQFKRSCAPDSAIIAEVNLSNAQFYIPSDLSPLVLLGDIDNSIT